MRTPKKSISIVVAIIMMLSIMIIPASTTYAAEKASPKSTGTTGTNATAYNLADSSADGNILHAFDWRYKDVAKYIKDIASQGFTSVQVSPVQGNKPTINAGEYQIDWWAYYQPINFKVGNSLGSSADFQAMCTAAHNYGVKIIVDIVANHMAQSDLTTAKSGDLNANIDPTFLNDPTCWHGTKKDTSDSTRNNMTQNNISGLPDLNTSNHTVQNAVLGLLKSCVDLGADGFRFDAAKHIELPNEYSGNTSSDFWTNVIGGIKSYKSNVYLYGEVLSLAGKASISGYTNFMSVTDYTLGNTVRAAVITKSLSAMPTGSGTYGSTGAASDKLVTWVESHDNFNDGTSVSLTDTQILEGYGMIGARKDAPSLFFVRPLHKQICDKGVSYDELMGGPGNLLWESKTVAAVNAFKNAYVGQSENCSISGSSYIVTRGTTGAVVTNVGSSAVSSLPVNIANGTYTDQVSGNTFTVSNGTMTGTFPANSVCVIYNKTATTPVVNVTQDGTNVTSDSLCRFTTDTSTISLSLSNATSGTYKISNCASKTFTGSTTFSIGAYVSAGKYIPVTVTATDGIRTTSQTYNFKKKNASESRVVYFDNTCPAWKAPYCFIKDGNTAVSAYPGTAMTLVSGSTTLYQCTVPASVKNPIVKFNEGPVTTGLDGRTIPLTVLDYGSATLAANREAGGFNLVGSMIWSAGDWTDAGTYTAADITDTSPTYAPTTPPTTVENAYRLGDVSLDGVVNLKDVTLVQKSLAGLVGKFTGTALLAGDVNASGAIDLKDATSIQKWLANMSVPFNINTLIQISVPTIAPTVAPTTAPTQAPTQDPNLKTIYFKDALGWVANLGANMYVSNGTTSLQMAQLGATVWSADVPKTWTTANFYRLPAATSFSTAAAWNKWESTGTMGTNNKFTDTTNSTGTWGVYNSVTDNPSGDITLYFNNSIAQWSDVYIYLFNQTEVPMTNISGTNIWMATIPVGTGFLFMNMNDPTFKQAGILQTDDITSTVIGSNNCCKPMGTGNLPTLSWSVYNP
ncbi:MAG: alpha-amylase family glycosyl hydrolase [Bacillota bacterium]|nr:alpha-amylase family glycosyl hydrolase [Bacillota bacterium]